MILYVLLSVIMGGIVLGIIWVIVMVWLEERRWKKLGYRVEFVNPYRLQSEPDDFAVTYHQDGKWVNFKGKIINKEYVLSLDIPEGEGYKDTDPQGINRKLMKERVLSEVKKFRFKIKTIH